MGRRFQHSLTGKLNKANSLNVMKNENKKILAGKKTNDKLINIAKELFAEKGYTNTSLEEVVGLAGVTRGALYHHFKSKKDLFEAVLEEVLNDIYVQIMKASRSCKNPWDKLLVSSRTFLKASTHTIAKQIVIIDAPAVLGMDGLRRIDENYSISALKGILLELKESYSLSSINIDVLVEAIYGASQQCAVWVAAAKDLKKALSAANSTMELLYSPLGDKKPLF